jgi:hypothetical protein
VNQNVGVMRLAGITLGTEFVVGPKVPQSLSNTEIGTHRSVAVEDRTAGASNNSPGSSGSTDKEK